MENLYIYQEVQFHARLRDTTRGWKKHRRGKTRGKEVAQVARGRGRVQVQNSVLEIIRQGRERREIGNEGDEFAVGWKIVARLIIIRVYRSFSEVTEMQINNIYIRVYQINNFNERIVYTLACVTRLRGVVTHPAGYSRDRSISLDTSHRLRQ